MATNHRLDTNEFEVGAQLNDAEPAVFGPVVGATAGDTSPSPAGAVDSVTPRLGSFFASKSRSVKEGSSEIDWQCQYYAWHAARCWLTVP